MLRRDDVDDPRCLLRYPELSRILLLFSFFFEKVLHSWAFCRLSFYWSPRTEAVVVDIYIVVEEVSIGRKTGIDPQSAVVKEVE